MRTMRKAIAPNPLTETGFMPMQALPPAFAAPFHALVPAGKKKRGPSQILS